MIYGYSKLCLTQLTSVSTNLDEVKLIKETIVDMFVEDPIGGWLRQRKQEWSMRGTLRKLMNNRQLEIVEYLEKEFCPIFSYQADLFTEDTIKLNRFDNVSSLLISFKKTAAISLASGLRFYKDPYLFNQILHIYTVKT